MKNILIRSFSGDTYHYSDRENFYKNFLVDTTPKSLMNSLTANCMGMAATADQISFKETPWGSTRKTVMRKFGSPRYIFDNTASLRNHLIFFYKQTLLNEKVVIQFHFLEDELFLIHVDFLSNTSLDIKAIKNVVEKKYGPIQVYQNDIYLIDDSQNRLIIKQNLYLTFTYTSGESSVIRKLEKQIADKMGNEGRRLETTLSELYTLI
jgi:hypothetical protein